VEVSNIPHIYYRTYVRTSIDAAIQYFSTGLQSFLPLLQVRGSFFDLPLGARYSNPARLLHHVISLSMTYLYNNKKNYIECPNNCELTHAGKFSNFVLLIMR